MFINDELMHLINNVNKNPDIVGVVNNGTTLDGDWLPFFKELYRGFSKKKAANWKYFYQEIDKINKEYHEVPGHHPHRRNSPGTATTERVYPTEFGTLDAAFKELDTTTEPSERNIGSFHCVFLNTGKESLGPKHWGTMAKKMMYLKDLSSDCYGLDRSDIDFFHRILEEGGRETVYLFLHCPIINSKKSRIGRSYQLDPKDFMKKSSSTGLGFDTILYGGGELVDVMSKHQKNIIMVTSHAYEPKYYLIDKLMLIAKEVTLDEFNKELNNSLMIKHMNTLCLGGACTKRCKRSGYISITKDKVSKVELELADTEVKTDIKEIIVDTGKLRSCLEKHRNLFMNFQRIVARERAIFKDVQQELKNMEPLFKAKDKKVDSILKNLQKTIKLQMQEYQDQHETEIKLLKSSLKTASEEHALYTSTMPKIELVFNKLRTEAGVSPNQKFKNVKSVFFEWYRRSIDQVNQLSYAIVYKENLFDSKEKQVITDILTLLQKPKTSKSRKFTKINKIKKDIEKVSTEIDSFFLGIKSENQVSLVSVNEEAKKCIVFLDTVLKILKDFEYVFQEQRDKR